MNVKKYQLLIGMLCITISLILIAHHWKIHGYLFDANNLFSHESVETGLIGAGIVFIISSYIGNRYERKN